MGVQKLKRLYTAGTENVAWVEGYSNGDGSQSKEADHLRVDRPGLDGERTWVTDAAVDLTAWSMLKVEWEASGAGGASDTASLVVSTNKTASAATYDARVQSIGTFPRLEQSIDISALSGNHYVRIHSTHTGDAEGPLYAYKVWLEP